MQPWAESFYNSRAWRECGSAFLLSKDILCERCSTPDNPVAAKIAHHKVYLTQDNIHDPCVALCWDNLEALCQDCHNKEHHAAPRAVRYFFDADGKILASPPVAEKFLGGRTPRGAII